MKKATNVMTSPGRSLELGSNIGSDDSMKIPKTALSTIPGVKVFYHTGKGIYQAKFVQLKTSLSLT